ncbi:MAG: hypothetical protein U0521_11475 [Anaerolineae bacterium]
MMKGQAAEMLPDAEKAEKALRRVGYPQDFASALSSVIRNFRRPNAFDAGDWMIADMGTADDKHRGNPASNYQNHYAQY